MKIKMLMTVRPDLPFAPPGTILRVGEVYKAESNKNGAITGICANGERLGVKPCEFEFVSLPQWVYDKWANVWPYSVEHATVVPGDFPVFVYGMRLRGFSPGAQPKEGLLSHRDSPFKNYYDLIAYDRRLTAEETEHYSLDFITEE